MKHIHTAGHAVDKIPQLISWAGDKKINADRQSLLLITLAFVLKMSPLCKALATC